MKIKNVNWIINDTHQGRIQDFKLGGAHLKKLRRTEGGAKMFVVFRVKNHDLKDLKKAIYRAQHWRVSAVARDNIWLLGTL
jgi:hypothetical protein